MASTLEVFSVCISHSTRAKAGVIHVYRLLETYVITVYGGLCTLEYFIFPKQIFVVVMPYLHAEPLLASYSGLPAPNNVESILEHRKMLVLVECKIVCPWELLVSKKLSVKYIWRLKTWLSHMEDKQQPRNASFVYLWYQSTTSFVSIERDMSLLKWMTLSWWWLYNDTLDN